MKYIPEHRYLGNLYTNGGDFVFLSNGQPYRGSYHTLSTGRHFTGNTPYNDSSEEIVSITDQVDAQTAAYLSQNGLVNPPIVIGDIADIDFSSFPKNMILENSLERNSNYFNYFQVNTNQTQEVPVSYTPEITPQDYENGSFIRYILYDIVNKNYLEVDKSTYNDISQRNPSWDYEKYKAFKLPWRITGTEEEIKITNSKMILVTAQANKVPNLELYLIDLTKFSNLKLPPQEFTYTVTYNSI
jgi:hypothetical protein